MSELTRPPRPASKAYVEQFLTANDPRKVHTIPSELEAHHDVVWKPLARSINALSPTIMPTIIPDDQLDRITE